jgi:hypothetical protein
MRKNGIIITLIGIGLFLISIFFSEGYSPRRDIISNMYNMEIVINEGRLVDDTGLYSSDYEDSVSAGKGAFGGLMGREPGERSVHLGTVKIEGRLSIPLKYLLALSTIITLVGIGKILLPKKQK